MDKKELIRLVIWDLDDTFWRGTLSEGQISYVQSHHDIIIELAKRGIISSICSKNDIAPVEKILKEHQLWDYFVFPSLDWTPKGARLKSLIEDIQLRPETVLFIDDHPANRAEALDFLPGLQVADETIIPTLLENALLKGNDDKTLTRLKQYQLLQRRKKDSIGTDNKEFLRKSNIRVLIDPHINPHLDRAVELINRTNQLNFIKERLPDDPEEAKEELKKMIDHFSMQAGLVRVWDNYGDYGFCGFYMSYFFHEHRKLKQFCFSCRVLGMGVEQWLYHHLGSPDIEVQGKVDVDLKSSEKIDWINQQWDGSLIFADENTELSALENNAPAQFSVVQFFVPEIRLRGGCEMDALSHYLLQETKKLSFYTNYGKGALFTRFDTSANFSFSLSPQNDVIKKELELLLLKASDYEDHLFASAPPETLFVAATWADFHIPIYRHKTLGFDISLTFWRPQAPYDLTTVTEEELENFFTKHDLSQEEREEACYVANHLKNNYTCVTLDEDLLRQYWHKIFNHVPSHSVFIIVLPASYEGEGSLKMSTFKNIIKEVGKNYSNVFFVDMTSIAKAYGVKGYTYHFDRLAYFDLYKLIMTKYSMREQELVTD